MNNFIITAALQNKLCDALVDDFDLNTPPADMTIYPGSQPAGPGSSTGETSLATITFENTSFGAASAGAAAGASLPKTDTIDSTGTAAWFRIAQGGQTPGTSGEVDGDVNTATADLVVNTTSFTSSDTFQLDTMTITMPAS